MICRRCGYSLIGLPLDVCPECGLGFDRHEPRSFAFGTINGLISSSLAAGWVALTAVLWMGEGVYADALVRGAGWRIAAICGAGMATSGLTYAALAAWLGWQLCQKRWRLLHRWSVVLALLVVTAGWLYNLKSFVDMLQ